MIRAFQLRPRTVHWIYYSSITRRYIICVITRTAAIEEFLKTQKGHMCEEVAGGENELLACKRRLIHESQAVANTMVGTRVTN